MLSTARFLRSFQPPAISSKCFIAFGTASIGAVAYKPIRAHAFATGYDSTPTDLGVISHSSSAGRSPTTREKQCKKKLDAVFFKDVNDAMKEFNQCIQKAGRQDHQDHIESVRKGML